MRTKTQPVAQPEAVNRPLPEDQQRWNASIRRLDARTAAGISPTAVLTPRGTYVEADSADDAYFKSRGFL
jgi:hypothetical protein